MSSQRPLPTAAAKPGRREDRHERRVAEDHGATWVAPGVVVLALPTPTLPPATTTNHVLLGRLDALVVDPATPDAPSRQRLERLMDALASAAGWRWRAMLLTHHHRDHVAAAAPLRASRALPVWSHALTAPLLPDPSVVDRHVADDEEVGGRPTEQSPPWRAWLTPGHAPGHLALVQPETGAVVAGDLLAGEGTIVIDPDEGDMGAYLASLRRLRAAQPPWILPAHGGVLAPGIAAIDAILAHRLAREARIEAALDDAICAEAALLPQAYGDVPIALWPLALRSLRAHLLHLRSQGRARTERGGWARPAPPTQA